MSLLSLEELDRFPSQRLEKIECLTVVVFIPNTTVAEKFCKRQIFGVSHDTSVVPFLVALDKYFKDVRARAAFLHTFHNTGCIVADEDDFVESRTC